MNKTRLIIKREYLSRVRNRTFLLSTFLLPVVFMLFIFGSAFFSNRSQKEEKKIAVINDPGIFKNNLKDDSGIVLFYFPLHIDTLNYTANGYDALLDLNYDSSAKNFTIHTQKDLDLDSKEVIENSMDKAFANSQLQKSGISKTIVDSIDDQTDGKYSIANSVSKGKGETQKVDVEINYWIGFGCGTLIYITLLIFGSMVMRGVKEEKTNRIIEIIISSVEPFELMMGKIFGIAAVALTQLFLWFALITVLFAAATWLTPHGIMDKAQQASQALHGVGYTNPVQMKISSLLKTVSEINLWRIVCGFVFYFLGGFLFYASLFAAVGSTINEDSQDTQALTLPITMPVMFSFIILSSNITHPDSPIMVWASIIPFSSPIVMMGRIPGEVPLWQLGMSMTALIAGFFLTTLLAAKIYRTGILMYGKKSSWKEMLKWAFRKS
jgi:ABC-2 type transport system permease protein